MKHLACLRLCDDHHAPINKLICIFATVSWGNFVPGFDSWMKIWNISNFWWKKYINLFNELCALLTKYAQEPESRIWWCFLQHLSSLLCIGLCWFTSFIRHFISPSSSLSIRQFLRNFNQNQQKKKKKKGKKREGKAIKISLKKSIKNSSIIIYFPFFFPSNQTQSLSIRNKRKKINCAVGSAMLGWCET